MWKLLCVNTKPDYRDMSLNNVTQGTHHGGKLEEGDYDHGHRGMKLADFVSHKCSQDSGLSEANCWRCVCAQHRPTENSKVPCAIHVRPTLS